MDNKHVQSDQIQRAIDVFRGHGGTLRTKDAISEGIHPRTLYQMRDQRLLVTISRGVYRLASADPISDPDLLTVAARVPQGVICLISALALHEITTQIPHAVDIALPPGAWTPELQHPPIRIFRFSGRSMTDGIENRPIDRFQLQVFCAEKTLADCFKFRNKIGLDVAIEALRLYRNRQRINVSELFRYAEINRVARIMRPYLESLT